MSSQRAVTKIGSNYTKSADSTTKNNTSATDPNLPQCTSKLCTVKAPHPANPFVRTSKGLPRIVADIERRHVKTKHQISFLDIFYTVHWDHINRPLPTPVQECVDKNCPVSVWSRHEAKQFSKNPKKADALPEVIRRVMGNPEQARRYDADLKRFWKLHGPRQ